MLTYPKSTMRVLRLEFGPRDFAAGEI